MVAWSSTKSKYRECYIWKRSLLGYLGFPVINYPSLWYDNLAATQLTKKSSVSCKDHIYDIDFHFMRGQVAKMILEICFLSREDQLVGVTKHQPVAHVEALRRKLQVIFWDPKGWSGIRDYSTARIF